VSSFCLNLSALESSGDLLAAVVEEEAKLNRDVEVDAEDVGLDGSAEADCGLEVSEVTEQRAAGSLWNLSDVEVDEAEHVRAHPQLEGVGRAFARRARPGLRGLRGRPGLRRLRGGAWAGAAGAGDDEEEEAEGEEESKGGRCL